MFNKSDLLNFMNCFSYNFDIEDIACVNGMEMLAKRTHDLSEITWTPIEEEGLKFVKAFQGAIKEICKI